MIHNRTEAAALLLAEVESWCERTGTREQAIGHQLFLHPGFVGLLRKRLTVSEEKEAAVRDFLERNPSGWHGPLPRTHDNGTRPLQSAKCRGGDASPPVPQPIPARDPCPRCAVRADIGCAHSHGASR